MNPPKVKGMKRRNIMDLLPRPPPLPSLSSDIDIGPQGRAVVDTSHGVDEVFFLSCHPWSRNEKLFGANFNNDEIDEYLDQFSRDRTKYQTNALKNLTGAKEIKIPDIKATTIASSLDHKVSDGVDEYNSSSETNNGFDSQARAWRAVLDRRESPCIRHTPAALTYLLIKSDAWQKHLLINATIRKIIWSLECKYPKTAI